MTQVEAELSVEEELRELGFTQIAGVDEAGRGPLAGPVVAAACILPYPSPFIGIADSKALSEKKRRALYEELVVHPFVTYAVGIVESYEVDQMNIHHATLEAMRRAVASLRRAPQFLLVDGLFVPPCSLLAAPVVHGDAQIEVIAAASILAKETRDQIMKGYHQLFPLYGFDLHKGYPTELHAEALQKHGPCPIHRKSFRGAA